MGTDINLQVQGFRDGRWDYVTRRPFLEWGEDGFSYGDDPTERFYLLFSVLCGARGMYDGTPAIKGRGLPGDGSVASLFHEDGGGRHHAQLLADYEGTAPFVGGNADLGDFGFTHATLAELRALPWDNWPGVVGDGVDSLRTCAFRRWLDGPVMQSFVDEYGGEENVRVLIGFD